MKRQLITFASFSLALLSCNAPLDRRCDELNPAVCDTPLPAGTTLSTYRHPSRASRPPTGGTVAVRNLVVTAIDDYLETGGSTGDVWVQEVIDDPSFQGCAPVPGSTRRVCGIQLFSPTTVPAGTYLLIGDTVGVSGGRYDEFDCTPCCSPPAAPCLFSDDRTLPEFSLAAVERIGTGVPAVVVDATLQQVVDGGDVYMGVLVHITDEVTLSAGSASDARRGEIPIGLSVKISPQIGPLVDRSTRMPLAAGTRLRNLTGIVSYFFGPKILPRSPEDFEVVR